MATIILNGLDGGNLLAYLAALGVLRTLSRCLPATRMNWVRSQGAWRPVVTSAGIETEEDLIRELDHQLRHDQEAAQAFNIGDNLTFKRDEYRKHVLSALNSLRQGKRTFADFLASFGSEAYTNRSGQIQDTAFRTMSGAGHQHFLKTMRELQQKVDSAALKRSLFSPVWDYADSRLSLRWDPHDFRTHALRATNPSSEETQTMWGANRLAVEALPLFPCIPTARGLVTTGFRSSEAEETEEMTITWPIWEGALDVGTVKSLLALPELQVAEPPRERLRARGIVQLYRARRFTEGRYRNFTPAVELL